MPTKYLRMIGYFLLGGGVALIFGSTNYLYRMAEKTSKYRDVLAPHLVSVPTVSSGSSDDSNQIYTVQLSSDDAFELWFLNASSRGRVDPWGARACAIGGIVMMAVGTRLAFNSSSTSNKKQEAEQVGDGDAEEAV